MTMDMQSLERAKQQWEFAADSMPQFICLLDRDGCVLRANRTVERWKPGIDVENVGGIHLHELLHPGCGNHLCYLRRFGKRAAIALGKGEDANCDAWDPILARHVLIRARRSMAAPSQKRSSSEVFVVVSIDDMTEWVKAEEVLRTSQAELRRLAGQHLTIQEAERRRIAADLHDGLGQSLSLLKLGIQEAVRLVGADAPPKALKAVKQLLPRAEAALSELHRVAMDLRPSTLDDLGILPTLSWFVREFESANLKTRIERHIGVSEKDVPEPLKIAIFRILQEAVNNAVKHAGAERIKVSLQNGGDVLAFTIEDDGKGFDPNAIAGRHGANGGLGLQSMRERAETSGGRYAVHSASGEGTKVCVWWPAVKAADGYRDRPGCPLCGVLGGVLVDGVKARSCYCTVPPASATLGGNA